MTTIVLILITIALGIILFFVIRDALKKKKQIEQLQEQNENLRTNVAFLVRHAQELNQIREDANTIDQEINNAKTDEEINNIVAAIVATNNSRLQDHKNK